MSLLLETIKVQNRQLFQLPYHTERLNRSRRALFGCEDELDLQKIITLPPELGTGLYKCRIIYNVNIQSIEFESYQIKSIQTLQLVEANELDYAHKYLDRRALNQLRTSAHADDILIVKNGFLTDTSYANVVFWDDESWWTPATPLLPGTKRQFLLDTKRIQSTPLRPADLPRFAYVRLINALLDLETGPMIPIQNIFR